jgi:ABC-2 type transport system ATP-binding protein
VSAALIEVRDLQFAYGERPVLRGVELYVASGEIYGLVGADGAGKTTLLQIAAGQLRAGAGAIRVLGEQPGAPALRGRTAYMPQRFGLYPDLSVFENLHFFADLHGLRRADADRRIADLLERTGLRGFEDRRAGALSGGMKQKLALASALLSQPQVMFLDEPTTGVDPLSRRAFWQLLEGVRADGVGFLYATANMDEAERCNRVGLLGGGRIDQQGTPLALAAVKDALLVSVSGPEARSHRRSLAAFADVSLVFTVGANLHVWLRPHVALAAFRTRLREVSAQLVVNLIEPSLHDATLRELALAQPKGAAR